ncbi:hypothetical protein FRUB_07386 [Fimbriiglobus ruber]|uniref:Uncharacterized protein n=1 Tax=Fimbriiglobus ruber TaxID=1908690 RepID=A0A225DLB2_9BACT|nr:hypothetical protein FRUB_07386 [Fimbriiglobus ruber]
MTANRSRHSRSTVASVLPPSRRTQAIPELSSLDRLNLKG